MADNVILVGFMGAGKSSVGRILARRLGRCFVETDEMITATEGRSIPEIFTEKGEAHFRRLEDEMVRLLALKRGDVIAKAGQTGSVTSPQVHFELRKGATAVDPVKYLSSATAAN